MQDKSPKSLILITSATMHRLTLSFHQIDERNFHSSIFPLTNKRPRLKII